MKKLTERDKKLAMILPTLIILFGYGLFFLRGKAMELRRTNDAIAKATPPGPNEIAAKRNEAVKLMMQTQEMQTKLAAVQKKWSYETTFCAAGTQRHDRVERLTSLLNKHHLTSMEDAEAEGSGKDAKVSPALESMMKKIAQLSESQRPQLRRIRFFGRFADVHDALDELAKGPVLAVPVGLSMKSNDHSERREWTLLVWL